MEDNGVNHNWKLEVRKGDEDEEQYEYDDDDDDDISRW